MHLHRQVTIRSSPEALWRCLTEPALQKQWIPGLVDETPDDPTLGRVGATSTMRLQHGRKVVSYHSVVIAWEPNASLAIRLSGGSFAAGMDMDVRYDLSPRGSRETVLDYDVRVPLKGVFFTLMAPIFWLGSASNAKRVLAKLGALAEIVALENSVGGRT